MTNVRARREGRDHESTVVVGNSYLALLRIKGAAAFSATAFVGRMPMAMYSLGTVLLISAMTGRYGQAGTVAAAGAIGYALCAPIFAKRADSRGQRRVLIRQISFFMIASTLFITSAEQRAPFWLLLLTGASAGASQPSLGPMVRARWSDLVGQDPQRMHTAFAVESVNDELIFVIGPALVTLLATQWFPASGVGTASILCIAGTLAFAAQRRTEPTVAPVAPVSPVPTVPTVPTVPPRTTRWPRIRIRRPSLPAAGLVTLAPSFLLLGSMFSTIDLSTVAFAAAHGHKPLAGLILGTFAFGSAVGGLWYGTRHWRSPAGRRFAITMTMTVAGVAAFWAMPGLLALDGAVFLAGLGIAPTLIAGYGILEQQAPADRRTEGMAWLGSTISVGVAAGAAASGHIIDAYGPRWGFVYAACCGVLAVLICLAGRARLRTDDAPDPAELTGTTA